MRIPHFLHKFSSPRYFYEISGSLVPWLMALFVTFLTVGLYIGMAIAPTHSEQGESYRIIFMHVPSASNSMMVYVMIASSGLIFLVWRIKLADVIASASAPIGASFTFLALVTGSIWGKPTWGTWWQWDARLTSELILLFLYLGYMSLRAAIDDRQNAARASSVLALVGVVNIPIIHYSVTWWNTLHQGATISKMAKPSMEGTMLTALLLMTVAMVLLIAFTVLVRARCKVLHNEFRSSWIRELAPERIKLLPFILPVIAIGLVMAHFSTNDRELVFTPTQLVQDVSLNGRQISIQGSVESLSQEGNSTRFDLTDGQARITVIFQGEPPRHLRTDWGARVKGSMLKDRNVFRAENVAALNVRDHRHYVIAAYLISLLIIGINIIAPFQCHKRERLAIARLIRREKQAK
ncbi:MAG: cytochrome c biogenesis protein CcsA [Gammaproteobacteria bacterium]|nr:cytochrome c biogenesis protein CcsA [Gammaproteobacteria bacterium]